MAKKLLRRSVPISILLAVQGGDDRDGDASPAQFRRKARDDLGEAASSGVRSFRGGEYDLADSVIEQR
jgi:hypothetical protein